MSLYRFYPKVLEIKLEKQFLYKQNQLRQDTVEE